MKLAKKLTDLIGDTPLLQLNNINPAICTCLGLRLVLTMPESMSIERRNLLAALGAELVLTPAAKGMRGAIEQAKEICAKENGYMPNQFESPANVQAH